MTEITEITAYKAEALINGMGAADGTVDAEKAGKHGNTLLRFRPDNGRARWVTEAVVTRKQ